MNELGERIRKLREQCGLSKAELARRVGVSDVTISYWENGTIKRVGHSRLEPLARALRCSISHLLSNTRDTSGGSHAMLLSLPLYPLTISPETVGINAVPISHFPMGFIDNGLIKKDDYLLTPQHPGHFDFCPPGTLMLARHCSRFNGNGLYLIEKDARMMVKRVEQAFNMILNIFGEANSHDPEEKTHGDEIVFHAAIPAVWPMKVMNF
ncbi:helix-turn-helix domain-containing protein [Kushneria indalinina]|uniref:Transcriptional regulator with XRE-family HTH domain n=1 Tax=Kushneria indalinina DSM 14324 TaxID=1122140 RepID=A0A3D9E043_9GAMM|nr:helix-turn-helix transcriptional regulator [Kushneria indalinina]REC95844.1 transcriptional regulator with XRE-family HTH domain [Kushneria indalinina DSM 14324]